MKKEGKAYAFFGCRASKKEIEELLPDIREFVKTPSELELSLTEGLNDLTNDSELRDITLKASDGGLRFIHLRYVLIAAHAEATNNETAGELADILNQAYQSSLYQDKEQFRGAIVYKENGEYTLRETLLH